jgi:hypothetical protein
VSAPDAIQRAARIIARCEAPRTEWEDLSQTWQTRYLQTASLVLDDYLTTNGFSDDEEPF